MSRLLSVISYRRVPLFAAAGLVFLTALWSPRAATAQDVGALGGQGALSAVSPMQLLRQRLGGGLEEGGLLMEGAIDPETYILGPGDQLRLVTGGATPTREQIMISADGDLVLPEGGVIDAAGRPLAAVRTDALNALRRQYRNVDLQLTLTQPRQFYVHVTGTVPVPGRYTASSVMRVSDVLEKAYAAQAAAQQPMMPGQPAAPPAKPPSPIAERPELDDAFQASLRSIQLLRRDGTQETVDLFRYFTTGDVADNPYLQDGDVVTVFPYRVEYESVLVSGKIPYQGYFPHRPGDTATDLLVLGVGGGESLKELSQVRLSRRGADGATVVDVLDIPAILAGTAEDPTVAPGDHLNVLTEDRATATAFGMVRYPATYPIIGGQTTLRELVEMAGGLQDGANVRTAYLERRRPLFRKADARVSDLDFFSLAYLQQELRTNRIPVDVASLLEPGSPDFVLQDGDLVFFPRDEASVLVVGNVPQPGHMPLRADWRAADYIAEAGGAGPLTTGIYVFDGGTGEVREGDSAVVGSGDTVFIDREDLGTTPELEAMILQDEASRRQARITTAQTILQVVTTAATVVTTILFVRNRN